MKNKELLSKAIAGLIFLALGLLAVILGLIMVLVAVLYGAVMVKGLIFLFNLIP